MFELIKETFSSIRQHKTRSILTGCGITWGIFILIMLLGIGNGFRQGTVSMFEEYAANSIWITGGVVSESKPGGKPVGTVIRFDDANINRLKARIEEIQFVSPEISLDGVHAVSFRNNFGNFEVKGLGPDYKKVKTLNIGTGRDLNKLDFDGKRRNVIIGEQVKNVLFGKGNNPIGKEIEIAGVYFQVVGVIESGTLYGMIEESSIYMPNATLFSTFDLEKTYSTFGILVENKGITVDYEEKLRACLAQDMGFSENDTRALYVNNVQLQVEAFNFLFSGLNLFLWFVGGCVLLCGVIGVTNIMLLAAKERSKEFGIRKAIGASSSSIILLLTTESLIITTLFGLIGMALGYSGISIFNKILPLISNSGETVFGQAFINGEIVVTALILLIICGVLAGILPAKKAASVMPVEALNQED